ncbi:MAG TPA: disulfide bond formation protein B, partial [Rhizomicrobium sp.]|nr:disulfide bond formation protein B [Rhizomicrobium sp.]
MNKVLNNKSGLPKLRRSAIFVQRIASYLKDISPVMIRDEQIARIVGAGAMALILGALGFQYIAHLAPCEMCHWQRWPHIAAAVIGLIGVTLWKKDARTLAVAAIILVAMSGLIGAYQWGMQAGLLPGPGACTVAHAYVMGSNAPPPEVSCNVVTWSLFGLSL